MYEPFPKWRLFLVPPHWFRLALALGPWRAARALLDPRHPVHDRRRINDCGDARGRHRRWLENMTLAQRARYYWGLPRARWRPSARIIRPLQWHPELARLKREQEEMREWARRTGRDPIASPIYQERLRRVRERFSVDRESERES